MDYCWIWIAVIVLAVVAELTTDQMIAIWFIPGAIISTILNYIGLDIITVFFILFPFVILNAKFEKTSGTSSNCFLPDTEYCFNNDIITPYGSLGL